LLSCLTSRCSRDRPSPSLVYSPIEERSAPRLSRRDFSQLALATATLLGARRVNAQSSPGASEPRVRQALDELVQFISAERAELSALVLQLRTGREIVLAAPDSALNPASNQKILTIAAALDRLGPDFRFTSLLAGRRGPTALSDVVLRSDGDPELASADVGFFADALVARGQLRIDGDLWIDQSAFDSAWEPPGYEQRPNDWAAYRAPVSAVAIDRNALTLYVLADTFGKNARVWLEPEGIATTSGEIKTGRGGSPQSVGFSVRANGTRIEAKVSGTVPEGRGTLAFSRRLPDPELSAAHALAAKLKNRGLTLGGSVRAGGAEISEELVIHRSRPLAQIIHALGKNSDNFTAEMLLKALGRKASSQPGTSAAGAAAVEAYLRAQNALGAGTRLGNGSGLYDANRLSARTLCRVLAAAYADPRVGPELLASLAIGGVDGTLSARFTHSRAARRIRAKTGTLANVTALSGYVLAPEPMGPVAFSLLVNGVAGKLGEARRRMDAVVEAIARA
jgi:D-alanyl-D-alanine carboxypeptidase/D-alanyl-D-alanine-endopeptidase (penicillin-binding protein 4)